MRGQNLASSQLNEGFEGRKKRGGSEVASKLTRRGRKIAREIGVHWNATLKKKR